MVYAGVTDVRPGLRWCDECRAHPFKPTDGIHEIMTETARILDVDDVYGIGILAVLALSAYFAVVGIVLMDDWLLAVFAVVFGMGVSAILQFGRVAQSGV